MEIVHYIDLFEDILPTSTSGIMAYHLSLGPRPGWWLRCYDVRLGTTSPIRKHRGPRKIPTLLFLREDQEHYELLDIFPKPSDNIADTVLKWLRESETLEGYLNVVTASVANYPGLSPQEPEEALAEWNRFLQEVRELGGVGYTSRWMKIVHPHRSDLGQANIVQVLSIPSPSRAKRLLDWSLRRKMFPTTSIPVIPRDEILSNYLMLTQRGRFEQPYLPHTPPPFGTIKLEPPSKHQKSMFLWDRILTYLTLIGQTQLDETEVGALMGFVILPAMVSTVIPPCWRNSGSSILLRLLISIVPDTIRNQLVQQHRIRLDRGSSLWIGTHEDRFYVGRISVKDSINKIIKDIHVLTRLVGFRHPILDTIFQNGV